MFKIEILGRVTDDFDRRCLLSILGQFFRKEAIADIHYYGENNVNILLKIISLIVLSLNMLFYFIN